MGTVSAYTYRNPWSVFKTICVDALTGGDACCVGGIGVVQKILSIETNLDGFGLADLECLRKIPIELPSRERVECVVPQGPLLAGIRIL